MKLTTAIIALLFLSAAPAFADEIVCTGEILYKPASNPMTVIPATGPWASMVRITKVDLETGVYTQHYKNTPDKVLESGTLTIVSPGSVEQVTDFVGFDVATGLYLRVAVYSQVLQFTRVEPAGDVQVGRCVAGDAGG